MSMKWLFGHDGLIWFVAASYRYIGPRSFAAWVDFLVKLPGCTVDYMRLRSKG